MVGAGVSVISATISVGSSEYLFPGGTTGGVFYEKIKQSHSPCHQEMETVQKQQQLLTISI